MRGKIRRVAEAVYLILIAALAAAGAVRESAAFYLVAVVLTLPFGAVALPAIYAGYAALSAIGRIWAPVVRPDGSEAAWLSTGSATLNAVILTAAAFANVLLLERVQRTRRSARSHR
ncbi:hypothetical protein ACFVXE_24725 [Streptomyces sp. NPDC058231]|uniref:hypothetical protein n=1 Tax=Streptomyces sp. NPDC058231 TaxID=3346392 RepID=UPI0036E757E1